MKRALSLLLIVGLLGSEQPREAASELARPAMTGQEITQSCVPPRALFWHRVSSLPAFTCRLQAAWLSGFLLAGTLVTTSPLPLQAATQKKSLTRQNQKGRQDVVEVALAGYQTAATAYGEAVQIFATRFDAAVQAVLAKDRVDDDIPAAAREHLVRVLTASIVFDLSVPDESLPDAFRPARAALARVSDTSTTLNDSVNNVRGFDSHAMKASRWKLFMAARSKTSALVEKSRDAWLNQTHEPLRPQQSATAYSGSVYLIRTTYLGHGQALAEQYVAEGVAETGGIRIGIARKEKTYDLMTITGSTPDTNPSPTLTSHTFANAVDAERFLNHHSEGPPWSLEAEAGRLFASHFSDSSTPASRSVVTQTPASVPTPALPPAPAPNSRVDGSKSAARSPDLSVVISRRASARALRSIFGEDVDDQNALEHTFASELDQVFGATRDGLSERKASAVLDIAAELASASMRLNPALSHSAPVNRMRVREAIQAAAEICKPLLDDRLDQAVRASHFDDEDLQTFTKSERAPRAGESALAADIRVLKDRVETRLPRTVSLRRWSGVIPQTAMLDVWALLPNTFGWIWLMTVPGALILMAGLRRGLARPSNHTLEALQTEASVFEGKDLLRYYLPQSWRELVAYSRLMNAPADPLIRSFLREPIGSPAFERTTLALMLNHNLLTYDALRRTWPELTLKNPEKAERLADILRVIQYHTLFFYEGGNASRAPTRDVSLKARARTLFIQSWRHLTRRTWRGRGSELTNLISGWLESADRPTDRAFDIHDWATGDGTVAQEMAERLGPSVRVTGLDKWTAFHIVSTSLWTLVFNDDGQLIQAVSKKDDRLWLRWTLASFFVAPVDLVLQALMRYEGHIDIGGRADFIAEAEADFAKRRRPGARRSVSLLDPSAERYAQKHPERLRFVRADVFDQPKDLGVSPPDMILVQSLLHRIRPYFSDPTIRERLSALGENLTEGGALVNSIVGVIASDPEELFLDFFRRYGSRLLRVPELSKGYPPDDDWNVIFIDFISHLHPKLRTLSLSPIRTEPSVFLREISSQA